MAPVQQVLRRLAALLIRGPEAGFILVDIDDAMKLDLARGVPLWRARWRYVVNAFASAFSAWRARWRVPSLGASWPQGLGVSQLDVKLGLRMLVKRPGLTGAAVLSLAVGIPVGLAPTHAVNAIQAPLPLDEGERIRVLRNFNVATSDAEAPSLYDFVQWREQLTAFDALAATTRRVSYNVISEDGRAAPVPGAEVTASTFDILQVPALLGRTLVAADEVIGAPSVVVIGYELWQSRLGGDPEVVGRAIRIGRVPHTVVGVMPQEFRFPVRDQLWLPLRVRVLADEHQPGRAHTTFGRLSEGVSSQQAQAELTAVGRLMAAQFPDTHARLRPEVVPFTIGLIGLPKGGLQADPGFYVVQVLALLVLVVACANVAMLILAGTATRSQELAVRAALGASRTRVVSQLFTEALALALLAAGVGLVIADQIAVSSRFDWMLGQLPYWVDFGVSRGTVSWALALAALSAGVVGVVPALKVTGRAVQRSLQRATAGRSGIRFGGVSSALIVADVTLAVLSVGVAVGLSSSLMANRAELGIQAQRFLSAELRVPRIEPAANAAAFEPGEHTARVSAAQQGLVRRLAAEPGVRGVAVADRLPGMEHFSRRVEVDGENRLDDHEGHRVWLARVDVGFFNALETPILAGRGFTAADLVGDRSAAIVNTSFVDQVLGGRSAIGRRVRYRTSADVEPGPWYEIVGVVSRLGMNMGPTGDRGLYLPLAPGEIDRLQLAIHLGEDPVSFTPRLRALASEVDPAAIIANPLALDEVFSFGRWFAEWLYWGASILIGILLTLSASGIYALMSFTVTERTREIGIRTALGAKRSDIVYVIARRSLAQLGVGLLLGMLLVGRLLFELKRDLGWIPAHSPFVVTLVVGVGVMLSIGMLACVTPTLRALRIMPTEALRSAG